MTRATTPTVLRIPHLFLFLKQVFLSKLPYFLPVIIYLLLFFFTIPLIPHKFLPPINTTLLPTLDTHLFFSSHLWFHTTKPYPIFDILAAIPYLLHSATPFIYILLIRPFYTNKPRLLPYIFIFGILNTLSVLTNLLFPTTPPWYYLKYGTQPASYSMKGESGLLIRVDNLFHIDLFKKMYQDAGKVVFGSWPSLHAAWPFFMAWFKPTSFNWFVRWGLWIYCIWTWWAALYLEHHYLIDILGGVCYVFIAMIIAKKLMGKFLRDDDFLEDIDERNLYLPVLENEDG